MVIGCEFAAVDTVREYAAVVSICECADVVFFREYADVVFAREYSDIGIVREYTNFVSLDVVSFSGDLNAGVVFRVDKNVLLSVEKW